MIIFFIFIVIKVLCAINFINFKHKIVLIQVNDKTDI